MKQRILSFALALCLLISPQSMAHAWQGVPLAQEEALTGGSADGLAAGDAAVPTPTQVYEAMIALKDQDAYREGTVWTNDEPYSDSKGYYKWNGGPLNGANISAVGCVAFAFILSDAAFGSLPARISAAGAFSFEDIKVGDILQVNNDAHTVIVLEVNDAGVVIAEGNNNGMVHWERTISKEEVLSNTSHYITRYPEGYMPPDDPEADKIIGSGTLDSGLTWSLTNAGTLTISGSAAMPDFGGVGDQPWASHSGKIRHVVIEEGVTGIGSCAFWNCGVLSAKIPSSVTTIGNSAFRGSSLISVDIPSSVRTIGDSAFQECQNLSSATVPEGVQTIGQNAFRSCTSLVSIALPASIEEVGAAAFFQCQALTSATFAAGGKQVKMGDNMFMQCYYLARVTLPESIDRIGEGMFQNCLMLAGIEIPQGAESIEASAFASCSGLTTVIIPDSVTSIGTAAFSACPLKDIYFTGSEAQWNSIRKLGDTASKVQEAAIHYEYSPTPAPPEETPPPETLPPEETMPSEPAPPEETTPSETLPPEETTPSEPTPPSKPAPTPEETTPSNPTAPPNPPSPPGQTPPSGSAPSSGQTPPSQTTRPNSSAASRREPAQALTPVSASKPSATVPFIDGKSGKEGWEAIKQEAANAPEGKRINVDMNGASLVPGDVFDSIKGQNVTISFDMGGGIIWLVNGEDVTADQVNDTDLSLQVGTSAVPQDLVDSVAGERQATQLSLAHSGDFGYSAVLAIQVGAANAKSYANLFYYNESAGELAFVAADQVNEDGIAEFTFTHASDYVIVIDEKAMTENAGSAAPSDGGSPQETETEAPETDGPEMVIEAANDEKSQQEGNGQNLMWLLLLGAVGAAAVGTVIYRAQKKGKK